MQRTEDTNIQKSENKIYVNQNLLESGNEKQLQAMIPKMSFSTDY